MKEPRKRRSTAEKPVAEPVPERARHWEVPEPRDTADVHLADGGTILLRRHGNPNGPRIVLSHGNGFSADAYLPFWSLLLDRFDVVVYDLRNHGRNPLVDLASHHMPMMVWDNLRVVRAIDRHFDPKPKIGIYHSLSAAIGAYQTIEESSFAALVLFDPPICPPRLSETRKNVIRAAGPRVAERTRGRRQYFADWEELAEQLRGRQGVRAPGAGRCRFAGAHHAPPPRRCGRARIMLPSRVRRRACSTTSTNGPCRSMSRPWNARSRSSAATR